MSRPVSLVAERAVRFLRRSDSPVDSVTLAGEVLSTTVSDESQATKLLTTAFSGDPRLDYRSGSWTVPAGRVTRRTPAEPEPLPEADRALLLVEGGRPSSREPYLLTTVAALRLRDDEIVGACGGDAVRAPGGHRLRRAVQEILDGAIPVLHDPPGALHALEEWLGEPLPAPISLRRLAQERLGMRASHDLEDLAAELGLTFREGDDPLDLADTLDSCLQSLRRPSEDLHSLRVAHSGGVQPIDWSRLAFDREFLRRVPRVPGTYRFFDTQGNLVYVGKSKNLNRRLASYFRETGRRRSERVQKILDAVYRVEYDATGSDLEAMLREAEAIRRDKPEKNIQREVKPRGGRADRLASILILEPAEPPLMLRAYLIRSGRLVARVGLGPRGGGLRRVQRILDDHFFSAPVGPTPTSGPDLDVEVVVRWIAANRDRVVAFDPTELRASREVVDRLRWFLQQGSPFDPDGTPIHTR